MALTQTQISELYVAIFNRASEGEGNTFWQTFSSTDSTAEVANAMLETQAAQDYFGSALDTDQAFIEAIYLNTLNKTPADDQAGIDYWVGRLEAGDDRGQIVAELVAAVGTYADAVADGTADAATARAFNQFNNRVEVSDYTAQNLQDAPADLTTLAFDGGLTVTEDDATVASAQADVDAIVSGGETFTLTTDTDVVAGTAGADTIEGVASSLSSARTLDAADQIDGGAGSDTLNVDLQGSFTGFTGDGNMTNVETVNLTNEGSIARSFSAAEISGVEAYNLTGDVNLSNLAATDAAVNLSERDSGTTTIGYATKVTDGTSDALALGLNNVGTAEVKNDAGTVTTPEAAVTVTAAGIEEVNITAEGVNVAGLGSDDAEALTVDGSGSLKLTDVGTGTKTVDASAMTGDLDLNATQATSVTSVLAGSGNDKITAIAGTLAINAEVNGGDGVDTLILADGKNDVGTVQYQMAGVENLVLNGATTTFSATNTSGLEAVTVSGTGNAATLANVGAVDLAVNLSKDAAGSFGSDHTGATSLSVTGGTKAAPTTAAASTSVSKSSSVELSVAQYNTLNGDITANAAQSFTADIAGAVNNTVTLGAATSAVFTDTNKDTDNTVVLQASKLTDLVVTNAGGFTVDATSDLSSMEALTVNSSKHFDATGVALASIASVELSGAGNAAQATLGDLGATDKDYGTTLTAEGLAANLLVGNIDTGEGQAISINVGGVLGDVTIGDVTVADSAAPALTGSINIDANGTAGNIELGALNAKDVTVDASGALGTVGANAPVAVNAETATFNGSELGANDVSVTATKSATVTGGIGDDAITVDTSGTGSVTQTVTTGLGADTVTLNNAGGAAARQIVTDFEVGTDALAGTNTGSAFADAAAVATFLSDALGATVDAAAVSVAYGTAGQVGASFDDGIFVFDNTVHIVNDAGTTGEFDAGDSFITLTGVTAAEVAAAADLA